MARLVAAFGTPHAPFLPEQVARAPGQLRIESLMNDVREHLEKVEPDVIIISTSDHFTNFFFNHMPAFCIGVVDEAEGPTESDCHMPHYTVRIHRRWLKLFTGRDSKPTSTSPVRKKSNGTTPY